MYGLHTIEHCSVGQRCQIRIGERRGTIAWTGKMLLQHNPTKDKDDEDNTGYWVGVQLDEPTGKNNGTVHNVTYFAANPNCGAFVRGIHVDVGDYPMKDDLWDDDDSDEEI
jgi:tubulin-specific chaperone B